jgi:hypothetical protein
MTSCPQTRDSIQRSSSRSAEFTLHVLLSLKQASLRSNGATLLTRPAYFEQTGCLARQMSWMGPMRIRRIKMTLIKGGLGTVPAF